jgi:uncharacterized surface protein with fasciclin (FAS1) repeats
MRNLVETAQQSGSFTTLVKAVQAAGLAGVLSGEGPFTVCAPNDEAFAKLPAGELDRLMQDRKALADVLKYHVVAGRHPAKEVAQMNSVTTLQGGSLKITRKGNDVMIGDARVIAPDVVASNGIIHIVDKVLIPR